MRVVGKYVFLAFACLGGFATNWAGTLTLEWDPGPDPDVIAFNVYFGDGSQKYTNMVSAGLSTRLTFSNLLEGVTYFFAVTSLDLNGLESDFSSEVGFLVPSTPCFILFSNMVQTYDGAPKPVSASAVPSDMPFTITYDGSPDPPTNAGSYKVTAVAVGPHLTSTIQTLTIKKANPTVTLDKLNQIYDGTLKKASAMTDPPGLAVTITYDGSATPPTEGGAYDVLATVDDPNYTG